jgi:RNA polymerase sigma-70 factor (ECF subfamily)
MRLDPALQDAMLKAVPELRAFAVALCHQKDRADDLVQEALLRAIDRIETFVPGTNMTAWLLTILRNHFCNEFRKRRREVVDTDGYYVGTMTSQPEQEGHIQLAEFRRALAQLPDEQREALTLIGGAGLSYEEAAAICHCPVGTVKSRANRGRARLAELLAIDSVQDFGRSVRRPSALGGLKIRSFRTRRRLDTRRPSRPCYNITGAVAVPGAGRRRTFKACAGFERIST